MSRYALDGLRDALSALEHQVGNAESALEEARDEGYAEGEKDGIRAGEQLVWQFAKALIDDVDRRRAQAELPTPLCPGYMTLDQVEKMIRRHHP